MQRPLSVMLAGALSAALLAPAASAAPPASGPPTTSSITAAAYARSWALTQLTDGYVLGFDGETPDISTTIEGLLGIASAGGAEEPIVLNATKFVQDNIDDYLVDGLSGGQGGRLGKVLLLERAIDTTTTGRDFTAELEAVLRASGDEQGAYLDADSDFNGFGQTTQQAFAILGLGGIVPADAITWLLDQQCANGGFANRDAAARTADVADACLGDFGPSDSIDATGLAVQALVAATPTFEGIALGTDIDASVAAALTYLDDKQDDDGGFGGGNPNSTALAIQAIIAGGESPTAGRWVETDGNARTSLLSFQLGCDVAASERGGLYFPFFGTTTASQFATFQGLWGLSGRTFPAIAGPADSAGAVPRCDVATTRASGEDRYGSAAAVSALAFPDGASTVLIATGQNFADALVAAPLAAELKAPVLLVRRDTVAASVVAEINRLGATTAIVLGGDAAVDQSTVDAIIAKTGVTTATRLQGDDRYATAVAISDALETALGRTPDGVHLAQGAKAGEPTGGFADALSLSSLAGITRRPILLTRTSTLPASTAAELGQLAAEVFVAGGVNAVSDAVITAADAANGAAPATRAHAGADRWETMASIVEDAFTAGASTGTVWLATGTAYPDALAGGAAAAARGELMVTVPGTGTEIPASVEALLETIGGRVDRVLVVGGEAAVGQAIVDLVGPALNAGTE